MAENHPVAFQWVMEAKEKGTTIIHVDPRFNRTSAVANIWLPLRAGSDIIFLGALIRHVLENELFFREYLLHFTNAPVIIQDDFGDTEDLGGVFSGWNNEKKSYDPASWMYEGASRDDQKSHPSGEGGSEGGHAHQGTTVMPDLSKYKKDETLQHPRCVFQLLKRSFCALHARDGGAVLRHFQRRVPACGRHVLRRVGTGKNRRNLLRGGLDAAFFRSAAHPLRCDFAVTLGQHGTTWGWNYGAARPCFDPGFH